MANNTAIQFLEEKFRHGFGFSNGILDNGIVLLKFAFLAAFVVGATSNY